jgi:heat shock protein HslJ
LRHAPFGLLVGLLLFCAITVASCRSDDSDGMASPSTSSPPTTDVRTTTPVSATDALQGPTWALTSVGTTTVPIAINVTAIFKDGRVTGASGCNTFSASYTVDGARLTIGAIGGTKVACAPPVMAVETAYVKALATVTSYEIGQSGLLVLTARDSRLLVYVEQAQTVVGSWAVTGYLKPDANASSSVLPGTKVTAKFDSGGTVSGSGGCNTYNGDYVIRGAAISIGEPGTVGTTLRLCADPEGVSTQETDFLAALHSAQAFTVSGDALTLLDGQKRRAVTMKRAATS